MEKETLEELKMAESILQEKLRINRAADGHLRLVKKMEAQNDK